MFYRYPLTLTRIQSVALATTQYNAVAFFRTRSFICKKKVRLAFHVCSCCPATHQKPQPPLPPSGAFFSSFFFFTFGTLQHRHRSLRRTFNVALSPASLSAILRRTLRRFLFVTIPRRPRYQVLLCFLRHPDLPLTRSSILCFSTSGCSPVGHSHTSVVASRVLLDLFRLVGQAVS